MKDISLKVDNIGILVSSLCMVHCVATPFLFIAKSCTTTCCADSPMWWSWLDYLFLVVSCLAIWQTTKTSTKKWISYALWFSWGLLLATILNEKLQFFTLPKVVSYIPATALIVLHFYSLKYCQCRKTECCTKSI